MDLAAYSACCPVDLADLCFESCNVLVSLIISCSATYSFAMQTLSSAAVVLFFAEMFVTEA